VVGLPLAEVLIDLEDLGFFAGAHDGGARGR